MGRRRQGVAAFSLFSFQDIVTSVTAILILVVLILTLELISRTQRTAAADPAVSARDLRAAAAELEALVDTLTQALPAECAPGPGRTRSDIQRDIGILHDQLTRAVAAANAARAIEVQSADLLAKARARLEDGVAGIGDVEALVQRSADVEAEAEQLAKDNERERDRLARKEEEARSRPASGTELVFNAPPDEKKQPWLVEVSGEGFVAVRLGANAREELGASAAPGSAAARWVASLAGVRDYVLILVRPTGVDSYAAFRNLLDAAAIDFGVDFIGEDQTVRDGTAEAGRDARDPPQ